MKPSLSSSRRTRKKNSFEIEEDTIMTIEIYWDDLKKEKQQELLHLLGDNNNWDINPIAVIEIEEDGE